MTEADVGTGSVELSRLLRRDPPRVGDFTLVGRIDRHDAGMTYVGRLDPIGTTPSALSPDRAKSASDDADRANADVVVVMLSAGAEADSYARARFREAVRDLAEDQPGMIVASEDQQDLAPWVAFTAPSWSEGRRLGRRLLRAVTLEDRAPVGTVRGPEFRPHWWERAGIGRWRLWPLPWPAGLSSAGRWTFLASFAVICAIAALALWIVVQVFQHQPPPAPTPGPGPGPNPPSTSPTRPPDTPSPGPTPTPNGPTNHPTAPIV